MKKYKIIALAMLTFISLNTFAQEGNVNGKVVDKLGNPVAGALVTVEGNSLVQATTDRNGLFEITVGRGVMLKVQTGDEATKMVSVTDDKTITVVMDFSAQKVNYGFGLNQTNAASTGAVSTVYADQIDNRSAMNVGNSLYGNVAGLATMQKTGTVWEQIPTMLIRGQKTLNNNNGVLLVVDGLERDNNWNALNYITPEEVESVSILRDAAAIALYGYRGINGVINVVTKRGKYNTREIGFSYDHAFNTQTRIPEMADSYMYASAVNEALANNGKAARYSQNELNAFQSGKYPYLYPNVNWADEVFRNNSSSDIVTLTFRGGSTKMRYFTLLNLQNNSGFIKNANANDGYSTQEKYSKANFRSNLDIDLTPKTRLQANIMGVLNEFSRPASGGENLMHKVFTVPSAAFPIKTESGLWGGNSTWDGGYNPVYLAQGRGYSKGHTRALYFDAALRQDLSAITKGLGGNVRVGYDNIASYWEDYRVSAKYGMQSVSKWENGEPVEFNNFEGGSVGVVSGDNAKLDWQHRSFNFQANIDWARRFGNHDLYSMLLYTYKYDNKNGINNTWYTQSASWYTHYGYNNRYFADFTLTTSASNRIDPDSRWGLAPTIGLSWIISNEDFMKNQNIIDFMKLRASFGVIHTDNIPSNGYWNTTVNGSNGYPIQDNFNGDGGWAEGRLPSLNGTTEKAYKYNVGLDVSLLKGLTLNVDGFYERRSDIWVSAAGQNSSVIGIQSPFVNAGIVDSWGTEIGLDYTKRINDFQLKLGGTFSFNRNKIIEMLEEPQAYSYRRSTGKKVGQVWGLQAIGYFVDEADIANSTPQQFGPVKPGDIKYKDINGDNVINEDDIIPMGYSYNCPEIYYGFNVGLEWKGIGFNAFFQGVANYTAQLTSGLYMPLIDNTSISKYAYNNRWTPENPSARFPRLSTEVVDNNTQYASSVWLADRSFLKLRNCEVYYKLPAPWLSKIRMKNAKLYVRGVDLFSIDSIDLTDPEAMGYVYPATRSVHVGLTIGL
ncbi:SusC/RagA family TonB-linked outer membrane protein [Bacteroides sp. 519]|uniref:SusC/RagA family TonB-linked outer membrane protein n=1 Tax=Bacteroides sp. 519 TaxID=2302937 RepID=UPI0013D66627|nr:SusC/RagA family TonB-linked outer membrane protein [Bacteroides sp. 519]NDV57363.1 SusC/RagA family TonB-linked outer membrane protein [Bacteroides sp. 519]